MAVIFKTSETSFHLEVLKSPLPVLVDFTATWCQPCKLLEPIVEQLADEWDGQISIMRLDVDENPQIAIDYQVMGVPTLILFKGGKPVERVSGYQPKVRLQSKFSPFLS